MSYDVFFDSHLIVSFLHIVAFVYWLGGDLGVYVAAKYVADGKLPFDERMRFMQLLMTLDMFPRSCLILMLPLGFHLASDLAIINLSAAALLLIWLAAGAWFALMWLAHMKERAPSGPMLKKIDLGVRYVVLIVLLALGLWSLLRGTPVSEPWLALKLVAFAGVMTLGLLLRGCVTVWIQGFRLIPTDPDAGNALVTQGRLTAKRYALMLWALLLIMGFLGTVKPIFAA
jgi:hypothetical protein